MLACYNGDVQDQYLSPDLAWKIRLRKLLFSHFFVLDIALRPYIERCWGRAFVPLVGERLQCCGWLKWLISWGWRGWCWRWSMRQIWGLVTVASGLRSTNDLDGMDMLLRRGLRELSSCVSWHFAIISTFFSDSIEINVADGTRECFSMLREWSHGGLCLPTSPGAVQY